jgi:hypothetical protein
MWTLAFGHHEDRSPIHGYETTREAAMVAFAKSWRREQAEDKGGSNQHFASSNGRLHAEGVVSFPLRTSHGRGV